VYAIFVGNIMVLMWCVGGRTKWEAIAAVGELTLSCEAGQLAFQWSI